MAAVIDSDQHLYESRTMWRENIDPAARDDALAIVDDELGYPWLTWRDRRLQLVDVQRPGETVALGDWRRARAEGQPPSYSYDEVLPDDYWQPAARAARLAELGVDEAVLFPNFGLAWERTLSSSLPALTANMAAWNRWCATVAADGAGRLHPVAHITLRDPEWLHSQLAALERAGVRLAMVAPALVDGRPMSHPDHDPLWAAFVAHGVTPVFHVADQPRVFDDAWYTDTPGAADVEHSFVPILDAVFLGTACQLAITDLIVNGALQRHPDLRIGVVELGSVWVPLFVMMLDGGYDFTARLNGHVPAVLDGRPSDYFFRQVRVSSFALEGPARLTKQSGDVFMCCSDYPHSEGSDTPLADYARSGTTPEAAPALFHDNIAALLAR